MAKKFDTNHITDDNCDEDYQKLIDCRSSFSVIDFDNSTRDLSKAEKKLVTCSAVEVIVADAYQEEAYCYNKFLVIQL